VDITQDVKALETLAQEVDEKDHDKAIATPERSRGSSQEPAATHNQAMSTAPPATLPASREPIVPQANATPSENTPALEAPEPEPEPEPEPQPEHTSGVAVAYTHLPIEPSTSATIRSAETRVAETTQYVKKPATQRQEVGDELLTKNDKKAITTGQGLFSSCSFGITAYTV